MPAQQPPASADAPLVAVNPVASRVHDPGRRERILAEVERSVLARTGRRPEVHVAGSARDMRERLGAAVEAGTPLVVAIGGDGTVRDVARVLMGRTTPLAIVPAGTANLFAATVGVPRSAERAAKAIADAWDRPVDLGVATWGTTDGGASEPRIFVVAAGLGFDALLMAATDTQTKRRLGRYAYFLTGARMLRHVRGLPVRLETDGAVVDTTAIQVLVANGGDLIPGVVGPALQIDPDDGLLDVLVVEGSGLLAGLRGGLEALLRRGLGPSRSGRSRRLRAARVRVDGPAGQPVEVDGDLVGVGWLEASCRPRALHVLVPDHVHPSSRRRRETPR
jgi:diacylglycerol kinase (ATP)